MIHLLPPQRLAPPAIPHPGTLKTSLVVNSSSVLDLQNKNHKSTIIQANIDDFRLVLIIYFSCYFSPICAQFL